MNYTSKILTGILALLPLSEAYATSSPLHLRLPRKQKYTASVEKLIDSIPAARVEFIFRLSESKEKKKPDYRY